MSMTGEPPPQPISDPADSHQLDIIICAVTTWIVAAFFVGVRFYTRRWLIRVLGPEDWVILGALVFSALNSAGTIEQAVYGYGRHFVDLDFAHYMPMVRAGWYTILWYQASLMLTKISILLLYTRILHYQHARYAAYAILAIVVLSNVWTFATTLTACIPLEAFWDYNKAQGAYCHPRSFWWASTGMHMATDFLIFVLPIPVIFGLKVGRRQKVLLHAIFAFGFVATLMSVIRLFYLLKEYDYPDFTYDNATLTYVTCIEVNMAIVCSCVMMFKPLIDRCLPHLVRSTTSTGYHHGAADVGNGTFRPPTIGSMPVRAVPQRHQSWIVMTDDDLSMSDMTEGELELIRPARSPEAHLNRKLGLPMRPESIRVRDPRPPTAEYQDGPDIRPSSAR